MQRVILARLRYTDTVEDHIRDDHPPLTARKVVQALTYARDVEVGWQDDPVYGHQVAAFGITIDGISFKAYLHPVNADDPDEGSFDLNTAFVLQRKSRRG